MIAQVRDKKSQLRQKIAQGRTSELDSELGEAIRHYWYPIADVPPLEKEIVAVDGSRGIRPLASGAIFYVARGLAIFHNETFRTMDVDAFLAKAKSTDIQVFVNRKMEWLEFKAAIKAIEDRNLSNIVVLLDGSLFGRLSHLPRDQPAEGMRGFMIDYFETFHRLLTLSEERNILLLGVSKDSQSSFLRDFLLHGILEQELETLQIPVPAKITISRLLDDVFDRPTMAFESFKKLKEEHGDKLRKVEQILWEAFCARTDHQLIRTYIDQPGHTRPLELSVRRRPYITLQELETRPETYVSNHFKESLLESAGRQGFMNRACEVLSKIPTFPTMVSFHVLLDKRDTPLRVDTPSWSFQLGTTIAEFTGVRALQVNVNWIISLLLSGYGGLKDYNIWLKRVDEKVRLSNDVIDTIYTSALQKELDLTVVHSRGYRRVIYP